MLTSSLFSDDGFRKVDHMSSDRQQNGEEEELRLIYGLNKIIS